MKISFSNKITTRLSFYPLLFLLATFVALACGYYIFSPQNPFTDFHRLQMRNLSSEKRLVVDMWFDHARKSVEYMSRSSAVKDAASINAFLATATDKRKKKAADSVRGATEAASLKFLDETIAASSLKIAVLLLKDGSVIASTQRELIGSNWSDRNFFSSSIAELKSPSVRVFQSFDGGMVFLAPVFNDKEELTGLVYAVPNIDKLTSLLHIENPVYKTEKVEMIDKDGNLMLTQKGYPDKRMKYNVPKDARSNVVELKNDIFFDVVALENAPFRLVTTVDNDEVVQPLLIILILCAVYAGIFLVVILYKNAYSGPKLISKPVDRLINAAKGVAEGTIGDIDLGKDYKGELFELRNVFESMLDELKTREALHLERLKSTTVNITCAPYEDVSHEFRKPLAAMAAASDVLVGSEHQLGEHGRKALNEILGFSKSLLLYIDNLYDFARLEKGRLEKTDESFDLCELMREVESYARGLAGTREIEVVVDCEEAFENKLVRTDRLLLKKVLMNLADNAVTAGDSGTITILTGQKLKDGTEYLEISIADTGKGFSYDELNQLVGDAAVNQSPSGLSMARKMSEMLGGSLSAESIQGKGSVFTVAIPVTSVSQVAGGQVLSD